jgi:transcription antitermination factor NusG
MNTWHVWSIAQQRYKKVKEYLDSLSDIEEYLYPTITKEVSTKKNKKISYVPLYSNYIFVKYDHGPKTMVELIKCPWLKTYVGPCSSQEIEDVRKLSEKTYEDLVPTTDIKIGNNYRLLGTAFKGLICTVREIYEDKLVVSVELFGSDRIVKCGLDDIILEGR